MCLSEEPFQPNTEKSIHSLQDLREAPEHLRSVRMSPYRDAERFIVVYPKKMRKYANNSENMLAIQLLCLSLHPKVVRKYAKYSKVWIELTGIIISSNS